MPKILLMAMVVASLAWGKEIRFPELKEALGLSSIAGPVLVCGTERYSPGNDLYSDIPFYAGPLHDGVIIRGIDAQKAWNWMRLETTVKVNSYIEEMVRSSVLYTVRRSKVAGKLKVFEHPLASSKVKIAQSYASCLEEGPKHFQCGALEKDNPVLCCHGTNKFFGFRAMWSPKDKTPGSWTVKFGQGNGLPLFVVGRKEPLRFCHDATLVD